MADLTADKRTEYRDGVELAVPVDDGDEIFAGAMVCVNADGYAVKGADAAGLIFQGIAREYADNTDGLDGAIDVLVRRRGLFKMTFATAITIANMGDNVFIADDNNVDVVGNVTYNIFCGVIAEYIDTTHAWVDIEPAITQADVATHIADPTAAHAASAISILDSGEFTSEGEVESALQELYQHLITTQASILVPLTAITGEDGTVLDKLAGTTSGWSQLSSAEVVLSMPVNATIEAFQFTVPVPLDLDDSEDITVHVLAGKAADNDVLTLDCEVFPCAAGDTGNADIQDTEAQTITQAASELVFTCGDDGVLAAPGTLTVVLTLGGTNDGDAVYIYGAWIEYTRKLLTS
jgi:hypothetical protein